MTYLNKTIAVITALLVSHAVSAETAAPDAATQQIIEEMGLYDAIISLAIDNASPRLNIVNMKAGY